MKDIGIRELKAHASELVRHVAEERAMYTITKRGRPVGVLAPADFVMLQHPKKDDEAWERFLAILNRADKSKRPRKSALRELFKMRR